MMFPVILMIVTLLLLTLNRECSARKWFELAEPSIYLSTAFDPGRIEYSLERDPFDFTDSSAFETSAEPQESAMGPTAAPTMIPTQVESESPTAQPSARYMFVVGNGGCATGKTLFEIRMADSWGDGWGEIQMNITENSPVSEGESSSDLLVLEGEETVSMSQSVQTPSYPRASKTVFSDRLSHGDQAYKYVCLDVSKCYTVQVGGGLWEGTSMSKTALLYRPIRPTIADKSYLFLLLDEVKWEIREVEVGVPREERYNGLASSKGRSPASCQFSVPDRSTEEWPCPVTCSDQTETPTLSPSASPA
jgi:hypothetical protein